MSLKRFRRPALLDKHEAMREEMEQQDMKVEKIIKKSAKKN